MLNTECKQCHKKWHHDNSKYCSWCGKKLADEPEFKVGDIIASKIFADGSFGLVRLYEDLTNRFASEKGEAIMTEQVEIIEEEFEDPKLSESQEIEIKEATKIIKELRVEEVLRENEARFYMIGSNFEEAAKRNYLAGFDFKLEDATLVLLGNDESEVYYMVVSDLGKLSEDIKYFRNKVLSYEGSLNPEFDKVELTFSSQKEDFRVVDDIESIEIKKG